ncbi:MAG TPA: fluoride efflux transporter CrcB [Woeseiaceae bacterium]|nr:fluoride efflux transporter CrcB [Woeseiaceae bacterium]
MNALLAVFLGAGLGGVLRYGVSLASLRLLGSGFPYGTLTVNVAGSVVMGLVAGWFATRTDPDGTWRLFLATGILGGFTTFSAYSLEVVQLYERGDLLYAVSYAVSSVVLSVAALVLGLLIVRQLA